MKETDLYLPVKTLFEELGYEVYSEVDNIDVIAKKNDDTVIIELKTSFNLKLIIQAIKRQRISEKVFIAIPMPKFKKRFSTDIKDKEFLLRRLELGLIFVSLGTKIPYAQIAFEPKKFNLNKSKSKKRKEAVVQEILNRHGDNNIGGTKGKLVTAYREKSIEIAAYLKGNEKMTTKELRDITNNSKATQILYNNHYGWFERIGRGLYKLSDKGLLELKNYENIINKIIDN